MEVYKITRNGKKLEVMETSKIRGLMLAFAETWKGYEQQEIAEKERCSVASYEYQRRENAAAKYHFAANVLLSSLEAMELITEEEYKSYRTEEGGERA